MNAYDVSNVTYSPAQTIAYLALAILGIVAMCKLFGLANKPWWAALIPIYSTYVLFEIVYGKGIKFLTILIPFYNIYVLIKLYIDLAKVYGKSTGWGILLLLVPIAMPIFAFQKDLAYQGITE